MSAAESPSPQLVLGQLGLDNGGQVELKMTGKSLLLVPVTHQDAKDEEFHKASDFVLNKYRRLNENLAKR